ncbi:MAG: hypothetical protein IVW57_00060 [Ktedonobacterales bacterium]|nr:hypothetical protein [Ktedonobacterales bacterium]
MAIATETYQFTEMELGRWGGTVPAVYLKGNRKDRYVLHRAMCALLGVERKRQLRIVRAKYGAALRVIPIETPAGVRPAHWIRTGECALWVGGINPARCKLATRENLEAFQADFKAEAERLLFEGPRTPASRRGMFAHSERMEYVFSCLYCGGGHRIIARNGEVTLERYEC